jgi:predicted glutamine amidotransferase
MCRWLAYTGTPLLLEELIYKPAHSLIDQSLHAQLGAGATNGDGVGVGWYGERAEPGLYRSIEPAWSDRNLRELARQVRSGLFLAHVRASTGTEVQQTNCHPFRHGRWLWMHNGSIQGFKALKRELRFAVDPSLYDELAGTTDSEVLFFLALTFGLEHDPLGAVERAVGYVERTAQAQGVQHPVRMTVGASDGQRVWAFRYASEGRPASLFHSVDVATLRLQFPDNRILHELSDDSRLILSEPFGGLEGAWKEVPESAYAIVGGGEDRIGSFSPRS